MIFYDFEVYHNLWCVTFINANTKTTETIINDKEKLTLYYTTNKDELFIGYNNKNYDSYIFKGILLGLNPKEINDFIILEKQKGHLFSKLFNEIKLYEYDVSDKFHSLKQLEGFMGNNIKDTEIDFNYMGEFTDDMIEQVINYNKHDVYQTIEVFCHKINDFEAHRNLIKEFGLPLSSFAKTKTQITAQILNAHKKNRNDEFDIDFCKTIRLSKYKDVYNWFKNPENRNYEKSLTTTVCKIPHTFGWGGLHGCIDKPFIKKGYFLHLDVTSYYPSLMIKYDFLSRNCADKKDFIKIYDTRVELKKAGKKKEQEPYKIILNSTYGGSKDKYSQLYDPKQANNICINGQLLLLDLLEHLEPCCKLIQSNTDGIIIEMEDSDFAFELIDDVCNEWEERTGMTLGFDEITHIWQKDVNNYILKFKNGKLERKGAMVKSNSDLDNDLPIVNEAVVKFLTEKIPVEKTINDRAKTIPKDI